MSRLDPVQIVALDFARDKPGVGWFLEQGLGKTLCALAEFSFLYDTVKADRMIVICPNSFKQGWVDEIDKHGFNFDVHIFRSTKKAAAAEWLLKDYRLPPILIINYEAIRLPHVLSIILKWAMHGKAYLAIDESIQIKSPPNKSVQTKAVLKLAEWNPHTNELSFCRYVRILTGRPQTQGPHDLWAQLRAIGLFRNTNYYAFRGSFCIMGGFQNKQVLQAKNVEVLTKIMAPVVFQAKKKDWLPDLPRKDYTIRDYKMSDEQAAQYRQMERDFLLYLESGVVTVDVAIAKYAKLAQIQAGFIYDEYSDIHELVTPDKNPRLNLMQQLLEEETEGKVCVVYRHRAVFSLLLKALAEYDCAWIRGGMTPEQISEQKTRFNDDSHCRIILLQAEASQYGHTLLGGEELDNCHTMIFFESSYNANTRSQIEDRIHRRGQTKNVLYIDLSGSDLDRRIVRALQRKESLYHSVFKNLKVVEPMGEPSLTAN